MNLAKLKAILEEFKIFLSGKDSESYLFVWEVIRIWQENWNVDNPDLKTTYDISLQSTQSRRLWVGENYFPKEMMLHFLGMQQEMVRLIFKDLFDDSRQISGRMDRFVFHCDGLLEEYKGIHSGSIVNRHFHDDGNQIISLYLNCQFPANCAYYRFDAFVAFLKKVGATDIPSVHDMDRYFKVAKTVWQFLERDSDLLQVHASRLDRKRDYMGHSMFLFFELCYMCQLQSRF